MSPGERPVSIDERLTGIAAKSPLAILQRVRDAPPRPRPGERCELCNEMIPDEHQHVVNIEARALMCSCRGCWILFTSDGAAMGRYRAVPDRYAIVEDFTMSSETWGSFQIPVSVAFFFRNSVQDRVTAFYPSPAGATESLLGMGAWDELVTANPILGTLASDVEALLVRTSVDHQEAFVVPIDACYELVGQVRRLWRGFDGGREAKDALEDFFTQVRARCR